MQSQKFDEFDTNSVAGSHTAGMTGKGFMAAALAMCAIGIAAAAATKIRGDGTGVATLQQSAASAETAPVTGAAAPVGQLSPEPQAAPPKKEKAALTFAYLAGEWEDPASPACGTQYSLKYSADGRWSQDLEASTTQIDGDRLLFDTSEGPWSETIRIIDQDLYMVKTEDGDSWREMRRCPA